MWLLVELIAPSFGFLAARRVRFVPVCDKLVMLQVRPGGFLHHQDQRPRGLQHHRPDGIRLPGTCSGLLLARLLFPGHKAHPILNSLPEMRTMGLYLQAAHCPCG